MCLSPLTCCLLHDAAKVLCSTQQPSTRSTCKQPVHATFCPHTRQLHAPVVGVSWLAWVAPGAATTAIDGTRCRGVAACSKGRKKNKWRIAGE